MSSAAPARHPWHGTGPAAVLKPSFEAEGPIAGTAYGVFYVEWSTREAGSNFPSQTMYQPEDARSKRKLFTSADLNV